MNQRMVAGVLAVLIGSSISWGAVVRQDRIATVPQPVFGTIQRMARNTIDVLDEKDKRVKQFIYMGETAHLALQQRVRVDYGRGRLIKSIRVMKVIPYQAKGQNLGYLTKQDQ